MNWFPDRQKHTLPCCSRGNSGFRWQTALLMVICSRTLQFSVWLDFRWPLILPGASSGMLSGAAGPSSDGICQFRRPTRRGRNSVARSNRFQNFR